MRFKRMMAAFLAVILIITSFPAQPLSASELDDGNATVIQETSDVSASDEITNAEIVEEEEKDDDEIIVPDEYEAGDAALTLNGNGGAISYYDYDIGNMNEAEIVELDEVTNNIYYYRPVREGYWFTGWYDDANTETANYLSRYEKGGWNDSESDKRYLKEMPAEGTIIYAGWEPAAVLNFNGGTWHNYDKDADYTSFALEESTQYLTNYIPERENYWFIGWFEDEDCKKSLSKTDNYKQLATAPESGATIYAGWTQEYWTITFDFAGKAVYDDYSPDNSNVETLDVKVPRNIPIGEWVITSDGQYSNYIKYNDLHNELSGWSLSKGGEAVEGFDTYVPTGNVTLYALYKSVNNVFTKDANGGYFSKDYNYKTKKYEIKDKKREVIDRWDTYISISQESYNLPKNADARKAFAGWYSDPECNTPVTKYKDYSCTEEWDGTGNHYYIKVTEGEDLTIYAKWVDTNKVLTLDANGGFYNDDDTLRIRVDKKTFGAASGSEISESVRNPQHDDLHKKFVGYYSMANGGDKKAEAGDSSSHVNCTITEDTTWYAKWKDGYHVVTFDANGGTVYYWEDSKDVSAGSFDTRVSEEGRVETSPSGEPTIDDPHKVFDGWYDGNTKIEDIWSHTFTKDTTLKARYVDCYAVTVNYNGGYYKDYRYDDDVHFTEPYIKKVKKGDSLDSVNTPYYEDNAKTFGGWFLSTDTKRLNPIQVWNYVPESDIELVAFWASNFDITFDAAAGYFDENEKKVTYKAVEGTVYMYNDDAGIPDEPQIDDDTLVFGGWYLDLDGDRIEREDILNAKVTETVTYTAKYVSAYSVTFDPNGGSFLSQTPNSDDCLKVKVPTGESVRGKAPTVVSSDSEHRVFSGWYKDAECEGKAVDLYKENFEGSTTLYAGWVDCYKLTFHTNYEGAKFANGTDTQIVKVIKGTPLRYGEDYGDNPDLKDIVFSEPDIADANGGYVFPGWYDRSDLKGNRYSFKKYNHYVERPDGSRTYYNNMYGFIPTSDMDFYAKVVDEYVTVKFNANNRLFDDYTKDNGYQNISLLKPFPSVLSDDYTTWTVTVPKGINFGDIGEPNNFEYDENYSNYSHDWAYTDSKCSSDKKVKSDFKVTNNMTVYVKWYKSEGGGGGSSDKTAIITYHSGDGYFYPSDKDMKTNEWGYQYGTDEWCNAPLPMIDDNSLAFEGWYYDAELTKPYEPEYQKVTYSWDEYVSQLLFPRKVDDLYAKYGTAYTVTFDANGGYFDEDYDRTKDPVQDMRETTTLKDKAFPGQYIKISDYTKRVRRDGTMIFGGWYYDAECTQKATVIAYDDRCEHFRPTASTRLYAKWIDYEKPDSVTAKVNNATEATIDIGESISLTAVASPELDHTTAHWFIDWYSAGKNNKTGQHPLKLDIDGRVTGLAEGEVSIYAEINGVASETITINVTNETVSANFSITDKDGNAFAGEKELYRTQGFLIKGVIESEMSDDLGSSVIWESSDPTVASVSPAGDGRDANVIAKSEGTARITGKLGKKSAYVDVVVTDPLKILDFSNIMTAKNGAFVDVEVEVLDELADFDIALYTKSSYVPQVGGTKTTYAEFVAQGTASTSLDSKQRKQFKLVPTAESVNMDDDEELVIVTTGTLGGKSYEDSREFTLKALPRISPVQATVESGVVSRHTRVRFYTEAFDAEIYYTLDGSDPSRDDYLAAKASNTLFDCKTKRNDTIEIMVNTTVKVYAVKDLEKTRPSEIATFEYTVREDWGDAEDYKDSEEFAGGSISIPQDIWYGVDGKAYTQRSEAGPADTDISYVYTGSAITFNDRIDVFYGKTKLVENRDYTVKYANNTNAAAIDAVNKKGKRVGPSVTISGKGNYTGSKTFYFEIIKASSKDWELISETDICVKPGKKVYLGNYKPKISYNGKTLKAGKDYELTYYLDDGDDEFFSSLSRIDKPAKYALKEAGRKYQIWIVAIGNSNFSNDKTHSVKLYTATSEQTSISSYKIGTLAKKDISIDYESGITVDADKLFDNRDGKTPYGYVYLKDPSKDALKYGEDFLVDADTCDNQAGTYQFVIMGNGKYAGEKMGSYTVKGISMSKVKIAGLNTSPEWTGSELELGDLMNTNDKILKSQGWNEITLYTTSTRKVGKKKVTDYNTLKAYSSTVEDYDYTYSFDNTGNLGTCYLTFTGKGKYIGTLKKKITVKAYNVSKKAEESKISVTVGPAYYTKAKTGSKPEVRVLFDGKLLTEGIDYSVSYKNNKKVVENYSKLKAKSRPTVVIKGMGHFGGTLSTTYFNIEKANIASSVTLAVKDIQYNEKGRSGYAIPKPALTDNDVKLTVGKNKDVDAIANSKYKFYYAEDTVLESGNQKYRDEEVFPSDKVLPGTVIRAEVTVFISDVDKKTRTKASSYYTEGEVTLTGIYKIVEAGKSISGLKGRLAAGSFAFSNAEEIVPIKEVDLEIYSTKKVKKKIVYTYLDPSDYEIVSVTNNRILGTATITVRGVGEYGGTLKFTVKIGKRKF